MNKTKVKILIPNSKESVRLPNKNRMLRRYTLQWIDEELKSLSNEYEVQVIELRNSKVAVDTSEDSKLNYKITPLLCPDEVSEEMRDLIGWAEKRLESSVIVLLQLTQPMRRKGLLNDAIKAIMLNDGYLVTSYVKEPYKEAWRVIRADNWAENERGSKEPHLKLYDGAIYVWYNFTEAYKLPQQELDKYFTKEQQRYLGKPQIRTLYGDPFFNEGYYNSALLWNYKKSKRLIYNYTGCLIDVDTIEDYKNFRDFQKMITETDNKEFTACLKEYQAEVKTDKKEYNETVTYTEEKRDYDRTETRG